MGPGETQGTGTLYVIENGEYREIGNGIIPMSLEITDAQSEKDGAEFPVSIRNYAECSITVNLATDQFPQSVREKMKLKCGSRKKFKKLLMSIGYSRNEAGLYASRFGAVATYGSYRKAWKARVWSLANWVI